MLYKTNMTGMYKVIFKFTALDDEEIDISGESIIALLILLKNKISYYCLFQS